MIFLLFFVLFWVGVDGLWWCRGYPADILSADIGGIAEALQNLTDLGAVDPMIKATVALSESGFVSVQEVIAFGEIKDDSLAGTFLSPTSTTTSYLCSGF